MVQSLHHAPQKTTTRNPAMTKAIVMILALTGAPGTFGLPTLDEKSARSAIISEVMDNKGKGEMDTVDNTELDF